MDFGHLLYNLYMMNKVLNLLSLVSLIFLLGMMNISTPSEVGPFGVLVFFTLVYLLCLGGAVAICRGFFMLRDKLNKNREATTRKREYYYGSVLAFGPVIFLVMQSFGGFRGVDVFLIISVMVVGCFYISKRI